MGRRTSTRARDRAACPGRCAPRTSWPGTDVGDDQLPARAQHPHGLVHRAVSLLGRRDVVDRQRARHDVEGASANGNAVMSAVWTSTRSATPAARGVGERDVGALPLWSFVHRSAPTARPVGSRLAASISTAPRPQPRSSSCSSPCEAGPVELPLPDRAACRAAWCAGRYRFEPAAPSPRRHRDPARPPPGRGQAADAPAAPRAAGNGGASTPYRGRRGASMGRIVDVGGAAIVCDNF